MSTINNALRQFYTQDFLSGGSVSLSSGEMPASIDDLRSSKNQGLKSDEVTNLASLAPLAEKNNKVAGLIAKALAFTPDELKVDENDAPPLNDANAWSKWNKRSTEFNVQAAGVTQSRIDMYNTMKRQGSSDTQIVSALVDLNKNLPVDYQLKSGLMSLNISV